MLDYFQNFWKLNPSKISCYTVVKTARDMIIQTGQVATINNVSLQVFRKED